MGIAGGMSLPGCEGNPVLSLYEVRLESGLCPDRHHPYRRSVQRSAKSQDSQSAARPDVRSTVDGKLEFPENCREWIYFSSGRGMSYGPSSSPDGPTVFDNVFVNPAAYRAFLKSGRRPNRAIFILEVREAKTVKDAERFAATQGWGFFAFGTGRKPPELLPETASCAGSHRRGARDTEDCRPLS